MSTLDRAPLAAGRERPPRLVLPFVIFTALGVAAAAAVILVIVRQTDTAELRRQANDRASFVTRAVLRPELRAVDLSSEPSAQRRRSLDQLFRTRVLLNDIHGAALYRADGRRTYSTVSGPPAGSASPALQEALSGAVVSEVTTAEDGARVLRTYVPLAVAAGRVGGAVALDQEYESIESFGHRSSWLIAGVLEGLLLLLAIVFLPMLTKVSSRIRRQIEELHRAATHDDLTGLANRLGFRHATENLLARTGSGAVALLDLDGFSEVNDSLGAEAGDRLLARFADRLQLELDDCVLFARLGEDEFGVLLEETDRDGIEAFAERIAESLTTPFLVDGIRVAVSVSIGAALFEDGVDFGTLLRRAGTALTIAKEEGRANVQICGPEHDLRDVSRLSFQAELREAVDRGELVVYYQPQSDLTTRRIRGVEALLRWEHPESGLLTAAEFIEFAERGGLARDIRHLVLETSVRQWQEWNQLGVDVELAVNLSPIDTLDVSLPDEIADVLERYDMPPWRLVLEITERTLIADDRRSQRVMRALSDIGVRLAIDDFGTGYSSLSSLRRFEVQQIKLDRCLLEGVPGDSGAEAIIGGCVEIAHGVGATVVAEGIETREQWHFVSMMGCDVAQGYLIGRPMMASELTERLDVPSHIPLIAV